ncbi:MAG: ion channel [Candidatus Binatus sp.]
MLAVFDMVSHRVVAAIPVGGGPDSVAYDASLHRVYVTGRAGDLSVIQREGQGAFATVDTIHLQYGAHTIAGPVCAYFLIGLAWAFVYRAMFVVNPHSFLFAAGSFANIFESDNGSEPQLMNFAYYSFATLTTTGFGDITPALGSSRALSVLEAAAGHFFIAILIARLVSLELVHSNSRDQE